MKFTLLTTDGHARRGRLELAHGVIETPIFMPVGTYGSVKAMSPVELEDIQAQVILGNTFHLWLRPGLDVIRRFGGSVPDRLWFRGVGACPSARPVLPPCSTPRRSGVGGLFGATAFARGGFLPP